MAAKLRLIEGGVAAPGKALPRGVIPALRARVGLMGFGDSDLEKVVANWAAERSILTASFPLEVEQDVDTLRNLDLLLVDAERDPLLSVAECARLRLTLPSLSVGLVGPSAPEVENAARRAGARWYFSKMGAEIKWSALERALSAERGEAGASKEKLGAGVAIDRAARVLYVDGVRRAPSAAKFDLLCYLIDHAGRAVSPRELVSQGLLVPTQVARIRGIIRELRSYLGPARDLIRSVAGYGYRLDLGAD